MKSLVSGEKDVPHSSIIGCPNSRQREKRIEKPGSHECDHPCFHRQVKAYDGSSPFPVLSNIAIFSQRK